MQHFYVEDSNLPVASTSESGITRLSDKVPSDSLTEAATIHDASKLFLPAVFASNLAVSSSNFVSTAVYPVAAFNSNKVQDVAVQATWTSNISVSTNILAAYCSNLSVTSSNALFPIIGNYCCLEQQCFSSFLVDTAMSKADGAQSTGDAALAAGTAVSQLQVPQQQLQRPTV